MIISTSLLHYQLLLYFKPTYSVSVSLTTVIFCVPMYSKQITTNLWQKGQHFQAGRMKMLAIYRTSLNLTNFDVKFGVTAQAAKSECMDTLTHKHRTQKRGWTKNKVCVMHRQHNYCKH